MNFVADGYINNTCQTDERRCQGAAAQSHENPQIVLVVLHIPLPFYGLSIPPEKAKSNYKTVTNYYKMVTNSKAGAVRFPPLTFFAYFFPIYFDFYRCRFLGVIEKTPCILSQKCGKQRNLAGNCTGNSE